MRAVCGEPGCEKPVHGRGLCSTHYERTRRREKSGCRDCGGPKPPGIGRKYCDECLERAEERAQAKQAAYQRQWYAQNREKVRARQRAQEQADPEGYKQRKREASRLWREANSERDRENSRRWRIERKYGLTLEEYDAMMARGCAICGSHEGRLVGKRSVYLRGNPRESLCIDHCHTTGKVRDVLCHSCNSGLGSFGDDPARLRAAADYLEKHRAVVAA